MTQDDLKLLKNNSKWLKITQKDYKWFREINQGLTKIISCEQEWRRGIWIEKEVLKLRIATKKSRKTWRWLQETIKSEAVWDW